MKRVLEERAKVRWIHQKFQILKNGMVFIARPLVNLTSVPEPGNQVGGHRWAMRSARERGLFQAEGKKSSMC